jgi:hypothetical protein
MFGQIPFLLRIEDVSRSGNRQHSVM